MDCFVRSLLCCLCCFLGAVYLHWCLFCVYLCLLRVCCFGDCVNSVVMIDYLYVDVWCCVSVLCYCYFLLFVCLVWFCFGCGCFRLTLGACFKLFIYLL